VGDVLFILNSPTPESLRVGSKLEFVITSEESGFRHLYQYCVELADIKSDGNVSGEYCDMRGQQKQGKENKIVCLSLI